MNKIKLIQEYKDTKTKCLTGKYKNLPYDKSIMYSKYSKIEQLLEPKYETTIKVINGLVLDVTEQYIEKGEKNIMVLNLASAYKAGGGVENGAVAQEEDIFRKTNYFLTLTRDFYPLPEGNVIYSDKVHIIKNNNFADIENPSCVSMLAAAAIKNPELINNRYKKTDYEIMRITIENIFKVAYFHKKETLILGALGCGVYNNPPQIIISLFNEFIKKYNGCFKNIIFAIYSTKDNNFELFNQKIVKN